MKQKYVKNDRVFVREDLPPYKKHFQKGMTAIIEYSNYEGRDADNHSYSVVFDNGNSGAWYDEEDLLPHKRTLHEKYQFAVVELKKIIRVLFPKFKD